MKTLNNYRQEIIVGLFALLSLGCLVYFYGIFLPFILGLLMAFGVAPLIRRLQRLVKSHSLASGLFLLGLLGGLLLFLFLFGQYINRDFQRLNKSFSVLASNNRAQLDEAAQKAQEYLGKIYDFDQLQSQIRAEVDSLIQQPPGQGESSAIDTEAIAASLEKVLSVFSREEEAEKRTAPTFSSFFIFTSTLLYFVLILFYLPYFESLRDRYFTPKAQSRVGVLLDDFNQSFVRYFKLRTWIVLLLGVIYGVGFALMDMPGLLLLTALIVLLSYIPYFQYLALIPVAIGCLVLSVEHEPSFLFYFGISAGLFVLASIVEEALLNPWIMEKNIGMNPVIMILGISFWSYLLGTVGLLIAVPLTSLCIIYFKRFVHPALPKN